MRSNVIYLLLSSLASTIYAAKVFTVEVSSYIFNPNSISGAVNGDIVQFVFSGSSGEHSIVQSSLAKPCQPLEGGFDSGVVNIAADAGPPFVEYNLTIVDATQPVWFYCSQTSPDPHCLVGMFGAINAGGALDQYKSAVESLHALPVQTPADSPTGGVGAVASAAPATGHNAAASTTAPLPIATLPTSTAGLLPPPSPSPNADGKLSTGPKRFVLALLFSLAML